jgi:hypothetical protein
VPLAAPQLRHRTELLGRDAGLALP